MSPPIDSKDSHKKQKDKLVLILASIVTVFLIVVLISGFASRSKSPELILSSSESVCENLNNEIYSYFENLQDWNRGDKEYLFTISNETSQRIVDIAKAIANDGIEWDSVPIVTSLLVNIANSISEIANGVWSGKYPAENYEAFKNLYPELHLNFQSVMNSACNQ